MSRCISSSLKVSCSDAIASSRWPSLVAPTKVQRASERALKHGTSLDQVLKLAAEIREQSQSVGLIIFTYLNPILRMGVDRFCRIARLAGVDGALVTDLPVEEAGPYLAEMRKNELSPIFLAAPTSTDERLKRIAQASSGFVYAVSRTGVTGTRLIRGFDASAFEVRIAAEDPSREFVPTPGRVRRWVMPSCLQVSPHL